MAEETYSLDNPLSLSLYFKRCLDRLRGSHRPEDKAVQDRVTQNLNRTYIDVLESDVDSITEGHLKSPDLQHANLLRAAQYLACILLVALKKTQVSLQDFAKLGGPSGDITTALERIKNAVGPVRGGIIEKYMHLLENDQDSDVKIEPNPQHAELTGNDEVLEYANLGKKIQHIRFLCKKLNESVPVTHVQVKKGGVGSASGTSDEDEEGDDDVDWGNQKNLFPDPSLDGVQH